LRRSFRENGQVHVNAVHRSSIELVSDVTPHPRRRGRSRTPAAIRPAIQGHGPWDSVPRRGVAQKDKATTARTTTSRSTADLRAPDLEYYTRRHVRGTKRHTTSGLSV